MNRPSIIASALLLAAASGGALAQQNWPTRPVKIVIPYVAGGPVDAAARAFGEPLAKHFGQNFYIDNKPGAGGNIGSDQVAKAAPDGYTLLLNTTAIAISPGYYKSLAYNVEKDLAPISLISTGATVLAASLKFPASNVADLIKMAKANPGKITFGSSGVGTTNHLSGELLKSLAGIDMLHVPFGGSAQALTSMIGGQTDLMFASSLDLAPRIKAGQIKGIAVTNALRTSALPDLQTIGETVPGYESTIWYGLFAPAAIPQDIVGKLSAQLVPLAAVPEIKAKFEGLGATFIASRPDVLAKTVREEIVKWKRVIQQAGIVPE